MVRGKKLGPILWQLPPNLEFDLNRVHSFLTLLPRDTEEAASIARHHEKWLTKKRVDVRPCAHKRLRHAIEIRHPSFLVKEFVGLLRAYGIALVCADAVEWPRRMDVTAEFIYARLHGSEVLYASGYNRAALDKWATRVAAWAAGDEPADEGCDRICDRLDAKRRARDVYLYFDNDAKVRAPFDAQKLSARLKSSPPRGA